MMESVMKASGRAAVPALVGLLLCAAAGFALTANAPSAHALFTSDTRLSVTHEVRAFPTALSVEADGYKARSKDIDKSQLRVTATLSDGTERVLSADEYELSPAEFPAGYKGELESEVTYEDIGHEVTASMTLNADEAYGVQYGTTLVFGRGIPADTYEGASIANATWGIDEPGCWPCWNKGALTTILDIDTVRPVNMSWWFSGAYALTSVQLDQIDTSRCTNMSFLFHEATGLGSLDVSRWNVSSVTTMERMFSTCSSLGSIDLSAWQTPSLTTTQLMFYGCGALTSVGNLGGWNMAGVSNIANMFDLCRQLASVGDISGWQTGNVTNMDCVFADCRALRGVNCKSWNTSRVATRFDFDRNAPYVVAPSW